MESSREDKIRLKCYLKKENEDQSIIITYVSPDISSSELLKLLANEFDVKEVVADYEDEEHEKISIRKENDIKEALRRFAKIKQSKLNNSREIDLTVKFFLSIPPEIKTRDIMDSLEHDNYNSLQLDSPIISPFSYQNQRIEMGANQIKFTLGNLIGKGFKNVNFMTEFKIYFHKNKEELEKYTLHFKIMED